MIQDGLYISAFPKFNQTLYFKFIDISSSFGVRIIPKITSYRSLVTKVMTLKIVQINTKKVKILRKQKQMHRSNHRTPAIRS